MVAISRPPQRVICDASNKPASSATAFDLSASGVTGFLLPVNSSEVTSGESYTWLAEEIDIDGNPSGAWQTFDGVYTDAATDTISQVTLLQSSTGSFIDWSGTGVDALARITAISLPGVTKTQSDSLAASTASYDIVLRADCDYLVFFNALDFSNDQITISARVSTDGSTFDSGASDYAGMNFLQTNTGNPTGGGGTAGGTEHDFTSTWIGNANDGEEVSGRLFIQSGNDSTTYTRWFAEFSLQSFLGGNGGWNSRGVRLAAQADVALRLFPSAGTWNGGRFTVLEFKS